VQLAPLAESLAEVTPRGLSFDPADLSDLEKEEVAAAIVADGTWLGPADCTDLEAFTISMWDTSTGEGIEDPQRFPSAFHAIQFIANLEREFDRPRRRETGIHHGTRGDRFQYALTRIASRISKQGYVPQDAHDLVVLCNTTLETTRVDLAGYAVDLLYSTRDVADVDNLAGLLPQTAGPMDHCVVTVHRPPTGAICPSAQHKLARADGFGRRLAYS
jgi:hypothetical protein